MKMRPALCMIISLLFLGTFPLAAKGQTESGASETAAVPAPTGKISYPIKTDTTLTYWAELSGNVLPNFSSLGDTPYGKALQEKTGISIRFLHPSPGSANEQFNLMIAGGELPDIIYRGWGNYPGGVSKIISDGVLLPLNDIYEKYSPNLTEYLKAHPEYDKMIKTDSGAYFVYPFIRGDPGLLGGNGLMIRKDWLDELGLQIPETIDEWYTVLKAFKEKKGAATPFTFEYNRYMPHMSLVLAYNIMRGFYVGNDGKAHYGQMENGYRDFLTVFAQWYKEGLVDKDLASLNEQQITAKMTTGISGASYGALGSRMGTWINTMAASNTPYNLVAAPVPVLRKGDKPEYVWGMNPAGTTGGGITPACENPELAARLLDWGFTNDGALLNNFGIEGASYTMVNGQPTFTNEVLKNPKGWPLGQALAAYALSQDSGPFVQDIRYYEQYMALREQKDALKLWASDNILKHIMPPVTLTTEESQEFARIMNEINTFQSEAEMRFILGLENISSWNSYLDTLKRMGIDRALELQNTALVRYNQR